MNIFLIIFVVFPILEIVLLIKVGHIIGILNTILLILVTGAVGAAIARLQGFIILQKIGESLNRGVMPSVEIVEGVLILAGGLCLLDPGVIGDMLGFILLVPWTRILVRKLVMFVFGMKLKRSNVVTIQAVRSYEEREELP